jgi:hypothetical protein
MDDWTRFTTDMLVRFTTGPMKFRLVLQPAMAAFFAIRDGMRDARTGRRPYLWKIATDSTVRKQAAEELWKSVGKVFVLAIVLDVVYQLWELKTVYPFQALVVAVILAIVPYLILRGIANRVARLQLHRPSMPDATAHRHP